MNDAKASAICYTIYNMTDRTPSEEIDAIYEEARKKIEAVTKQYYDEMDAYIAQLEQTKIEKLKKEMGA